MCSFSYVEAKDESHSETDQWFPKTVMECKEGERIRSVLFSDWWVNIHNSYMLPKDKNSAKLGLAIFKII